MPRTTDENLIALMENCRTRNTVHIRLRDGTQKWYSSEGDALIGGQAYEGQLLKRGELVETSTQETNRVEIEISDIEGVWAELVLDPAKPLYGARAVIKKYFAERGNEGNYYHEHFFSGIIAAPEPLAKDAELTKVKYLRFDVIPKSTASGVCIGTKTLSPNEGWKFPGNPRQSPPGTPGNGVENLPVVGGGRYPEPIDDGSGRAGYQYQL